MLPQLTGSNLTPFELAILRMENFSNNITYCFSIQAFLDIVTDEDISDVDREDMERAWVAAIEIANEDQEVTFN